MEGTARQSDPMQSDDCDRNLTIHESSQRLHPQTSTNEKSTPGQDSQGVQAPSPKRTLLRTTLDTTRHALTYSPVNILLLFVPAGIAAAQIDGIHGGVVFGLNCVAVIPLAGLLAHATETVAAEVGDALGALINVTFGNVVELIIFIIALTKDKIRIVQASLLGSILANLLLILGMGFFLCGMRYREQLYNSTVTQMSACLLSLSVISLVLPTAFHASFSDHHRADEQSLKISRGTSVVLLLVYIIFLVFQLKSHAYLYESTPRDVVDAEAAPGPAAAWLDGEDEDDDGASYTMGSRMRRVLTRSRTASRQPTRDGTRRSSVADGGEEDAVRAEAGDFLSPSEAFPRDMPNVSRRGTRPERSLSSANRSTEEPPQLELDFASGSATAQRQNNDLALPPSRLSSETLISVGPSQRFQLTRTAAIILLVVSTGLVALCAEFLISSIEEVTGSSTVSETFIGLIVLPIVGNAAEHITSITVALKNKMDLAIGVAIGSSIQIALLITPLVVMLGWAMDKPMSLYFTLFETVCLFVSAFIVNFLVLDGRSNYMEGALLCAVYVIIGVVAFFYPEGGDLNPWGSGEDQ